MGLGIRSSGTSSRTSLALARGWGRRLKSRSTVSTKAALQSAAFGGLEYNLFDTQPL